MNRAAFLVLLSHWRRHPLQAVLLCASLSLATALWTAVQAINSEAQAGYRETMQLLQPENAPSLVPSSGAIRVEDYVRLYREGWLLSPVLEGQWRSPAGPVRLIGADPLTHPMMPALAAAGDRPFALLDPGGRLIAGPELAAQLSGSGTGLDVTSSSLIPSGTVVADLSLASRLLNRPGLLSRLIVLPDQPMGLVPLEQLAPGLTLETPDQAAGSAGNMTASFHQNLTALGGMSFIVGLFIVHGIVSLSAGQRRGTIRILRTLGLPLTRIAVLLAAELLTLALVNSALGVAAGYVIAAALLPDVSATLQGLYGAPASAALSLRPGWVLGGAAVCLAGTAIAGFHSLRKLPAAAVLSVSVQIDRAAAPGRTLRLRALAAAAVLLPGTAALILETPFSGYLFLAALLAGTSILLPLLLQAAAAAGSRMARSALAEWFWADLRLQIPGLSVALAALLLTLSANIGVSSMVGSFRLAFVQWLDQRLPADLYITARDDAEAAGIRVWLEDRGAATLPVRYTRGRFGGRQIEVQGVPDDPVYRTRWPMITADQNAWDSVAGGTAALVSEQMARHHGLALGSLISMQGGTEFQVAGIYADYGNPRGQAVISEAALDRLFPGTPDRRLAVYFPDTGQNGIAAELQNRFGLPPGALISQAALRDRSLRVFERTFAATQALNILTLAVAGLAILTGLLSLWDQRLPQLAPVWALGVTRGRLAAIDLLRSLVLTALTALLALPVGLIFAWTLLKVINAESFGWTLPMHVFPASWITLFLFAQAAAFAAAAAPAARLWRTPPLVLLGVFRNAL